VSFISSNNMAYLSQLKFRGTSTVGRTPPSASEADPSSLCNTQSNRAQSVLRERADI
jgi:hypothetical protein